MKRVLNLVSDTNLFDGALCLAGRETQVSDVMRHIAGGATQAEVMALLPDLSPWEAELIETIYDLAANIAREERGL